MHYLHKSSRDFREITCDAEVLAGTSISKRRYAALLFELAEREFKNSNLAMSMAVNPSTLKKRIHIMTTQNISTNIFRSSFLLILTIACLIVLTISCSDITGEDGITNTEFQQAQSQMQNLDQANHPLYIINGERFTEADALSRINPKYIQSITILKGQEAKEAYGESGQNGVIKIQLIDGIDEETVTSDLNETPDTGIPHEASPSQRDFFIAVDEMPELIGGMAELQQKINYPEEARKNNIQGRVIVRFIVNEQGEVEDPQILRGISHGCDREVLRVVKEAKFKPAKQQGQAVPVQYSLPIVFKSHNDNSTSKDKSSSYIDAPADKEKWVDMRRLSFYSESGKMEGRVFDTITNKPLPAVNILFMERPIGESTDFRGKYNYAVSYKH